MGLSDPMWTVHLNRPNSVLSDVYKKQMHKLCVNVRFYCKMHRLCVNVRSYCNESLMCLAKAVVNIEYLFIDGGTQQPGSRLHHY